MFRYALLLISFLTSLTVSAQTVKGFVLNKDTKQRIAQVYIYNENKDLGIYNNGKGEFTLNASPGDVLFAAREGFALDTIVFNGESAVYFQLKPLAIMIEQVEINEAKLNPTLQYLKTRQEYRYGTEKGQVKDVFSLSNATVGLSIDAIYSLLSKQGRNARNLQKILERDYRESLIDYRFKPEVVARILNIKDPELTDFMQQYRPTYNFIISASDYTLSIFIKNSYASYKRSPAAFRLPPLENTP